MAPELFGVRFSSEDAKLYKKTTATDVFAFASVCYHLYSGYCPLHNYSSKEIIRDLCKSSENGRTNNPWLRLPPATDTASGVAIPDCLWKLVQRGWGIPSGRPTMPEVVERLRELL
ncbi:hypothetical protein B0H19DRAFT_1141612 [Mycena capillaripes]|nr:hypothetical protein B0H19DRAFT_1141612 [Mycena capillaripes]